MIGITHKIWIKIQLYYMRSALMKVYVERYS